MRLRPRITGYLFAVSLSIGGCQSADKPVPVEPPTVHVAQPLTREVTDFADYTGRTEAPESVDVRARVNGYIVKVNFKEGSEVKKGDLLFVIDPRPYEEELKVMLAQVDVAKAKLERATNDLRRADEQRKTPGAISQQEYDQYRAAKLETDAALKAAQAAVGGKQLNVEFTQVTAPIDGRVSKINLTVGNLVSADNSLLTSIVSMDPMYVYFDVDERTMLRIQELIREGKFRNARNHDDVPVDVALSTETDYPHHGLISFVDNKVDHTTGTLKVRATLPNPMVKGARMFGPGLFVRVRLPLGEARRALLVSEKAIGTDQGQKFLYAVVQSKGKDVVEYRPVKVGAAQKGGFRVVYPEKLIRTETGLRMAKPGETANTEDSIKPGDWIIVNGLQRARPDLEVKAVQGPMPTNLPLLEAKEVKSTEPKSADKAKP